MRIFSDYNYLVNAERKRKKLNTIKYSACLDEYQGIKDSINFMMGRPKEDVKDKFLRKNRGLIENKLVNN